MLSACGGAVVGPPPSPTPSASIATPMPSPTFSPKNLSVNIVVMALPNDPMPDKIASHLRSTLPAAWSAATRERSVLIIAPDVADVLIVIDSSKNDRQLGWGFHTWIRLIDMHEIAGVEMSLYTKSAIHELSHALGCCSGAGSDGTGHVADCAPTAVIFPQGSAIMCPYGGSNPTFNDYELRQMRL